VEGIAIKGTLNGEKRAFVSFDYAHDEDAKIVLAGTGEAPGESI
jgi:hypothetical protein